MSDRYTKVMLTTIAIALLGLVAQNLVAPLRAESGSVQRVLICDARDTRNCATLTGGQTDNTGQPLYWLMVWQGGR